MPFLKDKTIVITGASRGIGRAIALRCASDGANVVITGKTVSTHEKLPGTIFSVAKEVEKQGGSALAIPLDVRDGDQIASAVEKVVTTFGGIDVLINNASAIYLANTISTPLKRFDLMFSVNVRATFACSQCCIPHLKQSKNAHILNLAPPLVMQAKWFKDHLAYTMSKYGMSMCTLGMAEELKAHNIAVNALWPKTTIATAAIKFNFPPPVYKASRKPDIVADAAYEIICRDSSKTTGNFFNDEALLKSIGVKNFDHYAVDASTKPFTDLFVDDEKTS